MYLGEQIKKLGFGLMRLPKKGEAIDVEQVKVMVDKFLAAGFTYFQRAERNTAQGYRRSARGTFAHTDYSLHHL